MMTKLTALVVSISMFMPIIATAHDLIHPAWRGQDGTTYQEWTFDNDDNPAVPEVINNNYGDASASITVGFMGEGWLYDLGFSEQTGIWDIGGDGGQIVLDIANRPEPLPYKEIWVQVTYFKHISAPPTIDVPGADYLGGETVLIEDTGMGGGWFLDQSMWRIEPNPLQEQIILTSDPSWGSVIDQVVVDTICIPEPASIGLLVLGGLMVLRKWRQ